MNFLNGYKSIIGGVLIVAGAAGEFLGYTGVGMIVATVGGAIGVVGIASKAQRVLDAVKQIISVVEEVLAEKGN